MVSGMLPAPVYCAKKKPAKKNGSSSLRPIALMVIANPSAGNNLDVTSKPLVSQSGKFSISVATEEAPKYIASVMGIQKMAIFTS